LKTTWFSGRLAALMAAGLIVLGGLSAGCSDDEGGGTTGPEPTKITVEEIIFNPKSLGPGDTLRVTAVVTSSSQNVGDPVDYSWTSSGGVFLETNKASVRWVAPLQSAVYSVTVSAKNDANTSTRTDGVFVGQGDPFIAERAGELFPVPSGVTVYYTSAPESEEDGLIIRRKEGAVDAAPFGTEHRGRQFSFDRSRTLAAHMFVERNPLKLSVLYDDLQSAVRDTIMRDRRPYPQRANYFQWPTVSANGQFVCFEGGLLDQTAPPEQGGVDTFAVYLYHFPSHTAQRATFWGNNDGPRVSNCFFPSVSSDNRHLVFVSDRGGSTVWEYYALPINGTTVTTDTIPDAIVRLTDTGGQMASGTAVPPGRLQTEWHPGSLPILAVIGADGKLRLVTTDGSAAVLITAPGKVTDIRWSPNEPLLAAAITDTDGTNRIHQVSASGETAVITTADAGDKIANLAWSPDGELLIYAVTRGSDVWYEMFDFGGSTGLTKPVRISPATVSTSRAKAYGPPLQVLRPSWQAAGRMAYLFFLDESTPRVVSVDLSGIGD